MRKFIGLMTVLVVLSAGCSFAATYQVNFGFPETAVVDGFNFYELVNGAGVLVTANIPPNDRTFTFDIDPLTSASPCKTYYMAAHTNGVDGPPSTGYGLCYEYPLPEPVVGPPTEMVYEVKIKRIN